MAAEFFTGAPVVVRLPGIAQPEVAPVGNGYIYFDPSSGTLRASQNGGAYVDLIGGGAGAPLATTLALGNTTGGTNVVVSAGDKIVSAAASALTLDGTTTLDLQSGSTTRWQVTAAGHLVPGATDNTEDIGGAAVNRIRTLYAGTSVVVGGTVTITPFAITSSGALSLVAGGAAAITMTTNGVSRASYLSDGGQEFEGIPTASAPAVSPAGKGRFYFDSTLNQFMVSQNGVAYTAMVGGGGGGGWTDLGTIVALSTSTDQLGVGTAAPAADSKLEIDATAGGFAVGLRVTGGTATFQPAGTGVDGEAIGKGASATGVSATAVGNTATVSALNGTAIGKSATVTFTGGTAIGQSASVSVGAGVAIGNGATSTGGIAIGNGAIDAASGEVVIGSTASIVADLYIGNGKTSASPTGPTFRATAASGGSGAGGGLISMRAGAGDGVGNGGSASILAGAGGSTSGTGGLASFSGGAGGGSGPGGQVTVSGGTGGGAAGGVGGQATIQGGNAGAFSGDTGGKARVRAGSPDGITGGHGADVEITPSNAAGVFPRNGGSLVLTAGEATSSGTPGGIKAEKRFLYKKGANIASATTITLGTDGNIWKITGSVTIDGITTLGWRDGAIICLRFDSGITITNDSATPGAGAFAIALSGSVDFVATAGSTLTLMYDSSTIPNRWVEVARMAR